jgi:hypothetical protein
MARTDRAVARLVEAATHIGGACRPEAYSHDPA